MLKLRWKRLWLLAIFINATAAAAQPVQTNDDIEDVSVNRRHDFYLRGVYYLREHLPPGTYTLKVTIEDLTANKARTESIPITLALRAAPTPSAARSSPCSPGCCTGASPTSASADSAATPSRCGHPTA